LPWGQASDSRVSIVSAMRGRCPRSGQRGYPAIPGRCCQGACAPAGVHTTDKARAGGEVCPQSGALLHKSAARSRDLPPVRCTFPGFLGRRGRACCWGTETQSPTLKSAAKPHPAHAATNPSASKRQPQKTLCAFASWRLGAPPLSLRDIPSSGGVVQLEATTAPVDYGHAHNRRVESRPGSGLNHGDHGDHGVFLETLRGCRSSATHPSGESLNPGRRPANRFSPCPPCPPWFLPGRRLWALHPT
jgi:hypothetical protein